MVTSGTAGCPASSGGGAKALEEALGLRTVGELLRHYPRRHLDRTKIGSSDDLVPGELGVVVVDVVSAELKPYQDRRTAQDDVPRRGPRRARRRHRSG